MKKVRPFLKWAGGKFRLTDTINQLLPSGDCLVEPFVGAGAVFLNNHDFKRFELNDINPDLINLYQLLQQKPQELIKETAKLFTAEYNQEDRYYQLREAFNKAEQIEERASLFIYLNRHGYNGLCRYNKSGRYNVPFGRYKKPYFPAAEMEYFAEKSQTAHFTCLSFQQVMSQAKAGQVVYCDPPYAKLNNESKTAFTSYAGNGFTDDDQTELAQLAEQCARDKNVPVLVSNHDTLLTRKIYKSASKRSYLQVGRFISQQGDSRKPVKEVLALFE